MIDPQDPVLHEQLLGRVERQVLSSEARRAFAGQRVLITGAGGSVGSELARQAAACRPAHLTLFDHAEYNLFRIEREVVERWPQVPVESVLGDVTRRRATANAFRLAQPDVVYHAAAYKHVPLAERMICQAVRTNVLGAVTVARATREVGARFVFISTDKASRSRSVMGATKRLAEVAVLSMTRRGLRASAVRFGNILGSSGSVLEIMVDCVRAGRPIPLTSREATRYFMTAREAAALVMQADLLARGGEIYWLDMGRPVKMQDFAERLLAVAVEAGHSAVPIRCIGLRPGEKLREDLSCNDLELRPTAHSRIWCARQAPAEIAILRRFLQELQQAVAGDDPAAALQGVCRALPEFKPSVQALAVAGRGAAGDVPVRRTA